MVGRSVAVLDQLAVVEIVSDAINLDDGDGLAIAGLGIAEVFFDGRYSGHPVGLDLGKVAGKVVADFGGGFLCGGDFHFLFGVGLGAYSLRQEESRTLCGLSQWFIFVYLKL